MEHQLNFESNPLKYLEILIKEGNACISEDLENKIKL